jgi:hypothetical protein
MKLVKGECRGMLMHVCMCIHVHMCIYVEIMYAMSM